SGVIRMTGDASPTVPKRIWWAMVSPWPTLLTGMALCGAACLWHTIQVQRALTDVGTPIRVILIVAGTVAAGAAVAIRLGTGGLDLGNRFGSASVLALAGGVAFLGRLALNDESDATRLLLRVVVGVALGGAVLVLLPTMVRRTVLVLAVAA